MIKWFANNGVAVNLLMLLIVLGGVFSIINIKRELFPEYSFDKINIQVSYPGATPSEIEESLTIRVEEAIQGTQGIKELTSRSYEGASLVQVEVDKGIDSKQLLDEIKAKVDAINTFPVEAENPVIEEMTSAKDLLVIAISGPMDENNLKKFAEKIRQEITNLPKISMAEISGVRNYEISIEVSEKKLRQYGVSFQEITQAIRNSSLDLPGGSIKAAGGEILLRTKGQAYDKSAFENIVLRASTSGSRLTLGSIAQIKDGFEDNIAYSIFNGKPNATITVFDAGEESILKMAKIIKEYVKDRSKTLPEGVEMVVWGDSTFYLQGRLDMLINNGMAGLILVLIVLTLFLRPSLAFWVTLGIPISFLGTFLVLPTLDVSINLISLFGLILVLGIVVDDAIVVGESVFTTFQKEGPGVASAIKGTERVAVPVTFAVLTTVVAFIPVFFLPGFLGKILWPIPIVVITTLLFSLIESKIILPYHLSLCNVGAHERKKINAFQKFQRKISDLLEHFIEFKYQPFLERCIKHRIVVLSAFLSLLIVTICLVSGGWLKFVMIPPVPSDYVIAKLTMNEGTPAEKTEDVLKHLQKSLDRVIENLDKKGVSNPIKHKMTTLGSQPFRGGPRSSNSQNSTNESLAEISIELVKSEEREISAPELADFWRNEAGQIPGVKKLLLLSKAAGGQGKPIDIQFASDNLNQMVTATQELKAKLSTYNGIFDIEDNYSGGKREIQLSILPKGELLGLSQIELANQVRSAFYGSEAQRIQRGRDDVRIMVRYPKEERISAGNLENLRIRTKNGDEIPLNEVASIQWGQGNGTLFRNNQSRAIRVFADANSGTADMKSIKRDLKENYLIELSQKFPDIRWSFLGEDKEQRESMETLAQGSLLVLCIIYALMAIPFKSYLQPLIIMSVIPFGLIGAVFGHLIMFKPISMLSLLGILALTGVLVNDSLILVDYINEQIRKGVQLSKALRTAGMLRFRPILLTSMTTFAGLTPILLERSLQAQFLIPMAISLAFGILFGTLITLILVPTLYVVLEDFKRFFRFLFDLKSKTL